MKPLPPPATRPVASKSWLAVVWLTLLLCLLISPHTWGQPGNKKVGAPALPLPDPSPTLTIVPSSYADRVFPHDLLELDEQRPRFHVLLYNPTDKPLRLFQEWNSWGYFGLSFDITYPDGRVVHSEKEPRGWDKNFPSTLTVAPYGCYVFEVTFDPTIWTNSLLLEKSGPHGRACRLQAIYSIASGPDALEEGAWTGTIRSEERPYLVY